MSKFSLPRVLVLGDIGILVPVRLIDEWWKKDCINCWVLKRIISALSSLMARSLKQNQTWSETGRVQAQFSQCTCGGESCLELSIFDLLLGYYIMHVCKMTTRLKNKRWPPQNPEAHQNDNQQDLSGICLLQHRQLMDLFVGVQTGFISDLYAKFCDALRMVFESLVLYNCLVNGHNRWQF